MSGQEVTCPLYGTIYHPLLSTNQSQATDHHTFTHFSTINQFAIMEFIVSTISAAVTEKSFIASAATMLNEAIESVYDYAAPKLRQLQADVPAAVAAVAARVTTQVTRALPVPVPVSSPQVPSTPVRTSAAPQVPSTPVRAPAVKDSFEFSPIVFTATFVGDSDDDTTEEERPCTPQFALDPPSAEYTCESPIQESSIYEPHSPEYAPTSPQYSPTSPTAPGAPVAFRRPIVTGNSWMISQAPFAPFVELHFTGENFGSRRSLASAFARYAPPTAGGKRKRSSEPEEPVRKSTRPRIASRKYEDCEVRSDLLGSDDECME